MNLDDFDNKIIQQLNENARTSFATIGRSVGLTAPAVAQRVQKMETAGIIKGYTLSLDETKMGFNLKVIITIIVGFGKFKAFQNEIKKMEEIKKWYRVTGDDCMMMEVHLENNQHLVRFLDKVAKYGNTKTNIVLEESE